MRSVGIKTQSPKLETQNSKQKTMFTVALIGLDGAGKTTISDKLRESFPLPMKYLYMGINIDSSNVALPTSRLAHALKKYKQRKKHGGDKSLDSKALYHQVRPKSKKSNPVRSALRLLNRVADESYRQVVSWGYQLRGNIVLYDRHYLFDFALIDLESKTQKVRLSDRLHRWFITRVLARPDMVIFLDAPPEVLYARKGEWSVEYLRERREAVLYQGEKTLNFIRVDATQPVEKVYDDVCRNILRFHEAKKSGKVHRNGKPEA